MLSICAADLEPDLGTTADEVMASSKTITVDAKVTVSTTSEITGIFAEIGEAGPGSNLVPVVGL